ncbi:hypothetical protein B0A50_01775 [Salinomyces thailandicus]|uniref:CN hydrolase domain-containing protein n=1 Tax=Salinomyces thailandicus TaxID=706561 RepID=A0A4U0U9D6_9PEZI|nr:hypothetical protein B0A50_01775 [Salinomyces thailandica]
MASTLRAAACHVSPVFLSARSTTDKCLSLIHQAAKNEANVVAFPESFIPAFPLWSSLRPPTANHDFFEAMAKESIYADGAEVRAIQHAAKQHKVAVSIGISEKVRYSNATLFNSNLIINDDGNTLVHHRKLMPTFFEKLTWSPGDGHGLRVADTRSGRIGNLICGENTNPLARYTLMAQREQLHISTWPAVWPTRSPNFGVASTGQQENTKTNVPPQQPRNEGANYDNVTANRTRAAAHCFEAKCFGMLCSGVLDQAAIDTVTSGSADPAAMAAFFEASPRGVSMFLDPTGAPLPGFTVDQDGKQIPTEYLQDKEGILYADMDIERCIEGKQYHDVVGGYQRFDIFELKVDRSRKEPVVFTDETRGQVRDEEGAAREPGRDLSRL